ncbi:hypothetical protein ACFJIY_24280 [Pimelobacter simplex]|uniref:hypothetical protein n=1 Tax=Nocardioides simplex TaxID=2045 RepID=UPI00366E6F44
MRPLLRATTAGTAAATAVLVLASGCTVLGGSGDDLAAGEVVRATTDAPAPGSDAAERGWTADLQLPDGRLTARIAPLPDAGTAATDDVTPDDGTTLVAVSWATEAGAGVPAPVQTSVLDPRVPDELALVAGDRRIPLEVDGLSRTEGFVYVALAEPGDWAFEVVFDGVAQSVTEGATAPHVDAAAQPLYAPAASEATDYTSCLSAVTPASFTRTGGSAFCRARTASWPWVAGQGWSVGGPWHVVQLETTLQPAAGTAVVGAEVSATLDGAAPVATSDDDRSGSPGATSSTLVFAPGGTRFEVRRTSTVGGDPVTLTGSLPLTR